ncbi:hypothetical protein L873DRAFT_1793392 [Choiromyces venosus 120613-1]|uniref:Uncharacterized protein n=1 Tax=Choiromyces venosus 120613-1 TaxID=1336337 RepID=A0A3N4J672_9PEZI|nr:hypothetical protein L873DRAFT_1793392 [Choiromyces venosus 120613-1]
MQEEGGNKYIHIRGIGGEEVVGSQSVGGAAGEVSIVGLDTESREKVSGQIKRARGGGGKRLRQDKLEMGSDEEENGEEEDLHTSKKVWREQNTTGHAIAQALDRLGTTAQTIQRSKIELTIERLQQDYSSSLTTNELVQAFLVMESEVKASIFISLQPGEARDRWLQEAICKL